MRYGAVAAATPDDTTALPAQRWWRGQDPDPQLVRWMFVDEGRTEVEIAAAMKISRARLAAVLTELGVDRGRRVRRVCPVGDADLRVLLEQGATVASLARRFSVAKVTVQRWLAGAGLLLADPAVNVDALSRLYVEQGRTIGEVAAALGLCRVRVEVALAVAGIPARRRTERQPSGRRADVTVEMLRELYSRPEVTVRVLVQRFGVSEDYLRRRLHALGLTRRPGTFAPRLPSPTRQGLADSAPTLYRQGWTLKQIGEQLGTSVSTVRAALVAARVPVRGAGGGPRSSERPARVLLDDLYADPDIVAVLAEHGVRRPGAAGWQRTGARQSYAPLPLTAGLLTALYLGVGLATSDIALLCGVGNNMVSGGLHEHHVELGPAKIASPWKQRHAPPRKAAGGHRG